MIAYVSGLLADIEASSAVVDVNGVAYRVFTPVREDLVRIGVGNKITLYTYLKVSQDDVQLFGFIRKSDLELFKMLIGVNGVGPRYALAILTQLEADAVQFAIASGDYKALTKVSGIGAKTAQRIVLDLKDKVGMPERSDIGNTAAITSAASGTGVAAEAAAAMEALGYSRTEAMQVLQRIDTEGRTVEQILKDALKQLAIM
ncbi:MAG: Holliday junction branch migration protein RuvA [Firmicutes bacterium]|nr:Holliday junction branch migration protein RuvA [Bacillota bacterium]